MWAVSTQWGSCKYQHDKKCTSQHSLSIHFLQTFIVAGGWDGSSYLSSTEVLTAGASEWRTGGALPSPRNTLRGVTILNQFYVTGECRQCIYSVLCHSLYSQVDMTAVMSSLMSSATSQSLRSGPAPGTSPHRDITMGCQLWTLLQ